MQKGDQHMVKKAWRELEAKRATIMWQKTYPPEHNRREEMLDTLG